MSSFYIESKCLNKKTLGLKNYEFRDIQDLNYISLQKYSSNGIIFSQGICKEGELLGIGSIIKALRKEKGITVYDLSEGICSERYMYMIENNSKYPSVDILRKLSDRLELNIFDYLLYIGFSNPIKSKWMIEEFRKLREINDFDSLKQLNSEAISGKDCNKSLIKNEILSNRIVLELFVHNNPENARKIIFAGIKEITKKSIPELLDSNCDHSDYYLITLLNYYFIYLMMIEDHVNAYRVLKPLRECLFKNKNSSLYRYIYISVTINYFQYKINIAQDKDYFDELMEFFTFQVENKVLDRIYFTYYFLGNHYLYINDQVNFRKYYDKFFASKVVFEDDKRYQRLLNETSDIIELYYSDKKINLDICLGL